MQVEGADALRSDASGRFSSSAVPTGTRMMFVRKVGYLPLVMPIDVVDRGVRDRTIVLDKGVALNAVTVTAVRERSRDQREFQERQLAGFARIMEGTQIKKFPQLRDAIAMLPGIMVVGDVRGDFTILGRAATGGVGEDRRVLVLLPPSEGKTAPRRGACDDCMDCFAVCPEPQVIRPALKQVGQTHPLILASDCTTCGRCIDVCDKQVFKMTHRFDQRSE